MKDEPVVRQKFRAYHSIELPTSSRLPRRRHQCCGMVQGIRNLIWLGMCDRVEWAWTYWLKTQLLIRAR